MQGLSLDPRTLVAQRLCSIELPAQGALPVEASGSVLVRRVTMRRAPARIEDPVRIVLPLVAFERESSRTVSTTRTKQKSSSFLQENSTFPLKQLRRRSPMSLEKEWGRRSFQHSGQRRRWLKFALWFWEKCTMMLCDGRSSARVGPQQGHSPGTINL